MARGLMILSQVLCSVILMGNLTSCVTKRETYANSNLTEHPVEFRSGFFAMQPDSVSGLDDLRGKPSVRNIRNALDPSFNAPELDYPDSSTASLSFLDSKHLLLRVHDGNEVIDSLLLKGKWYQGQFAIRKKLIPILLPPIFIFYWECQILVAFTEKELVVTEMNESVMLVLMGNGGGEWVRSTYPVLTGGSSGSQD